MYFQNYNPLGNVFLSTLVAAVPILTLLYFIALHPHRDEDGVRHLGIAAPYAAFYGVIAALLVSVLAFRMPVASAVSAFALGSMSGFLGIIWIVLAAMFLYTMTVITGKFEIVKESIIHISFDRRLQVLLIAFSFGAIIEGTSGLRHPGGDRRRGHGRARLLALPVGRPEPPREHRAGGLGRDRHADRHAGRGQRARPADALRDGGPPAPVGLGARAVLAGRDVRVHGGRHAGRTSGRCGRGCAVSGVSFALMQWFASGTNALHLVTDVVAGVFSVICTALFLCVWHPKTRFLLRSERAAAGVRRPAEARGLEVPVHVGPDGRRVDALGDPDPLLRAVGHARVQDDAEQRLPGRQDRHDPARLEVQRDPLAARVGNAGPPQHGPEDAAGGQAGRQAGGRQVHDQLALGRRHRRLRRRAPLGPRIWGSPAASGARRSPAPRGA